MTEKRDKVNVDDIIGLIKTDEPTDSVTLKKEAQLNICERKLLDMEEDRDYYKTKSASLEEGYIKLQKENEQLKKELNKLKKFEYGGEHIRLSINIETGELQRHIHATGQWFGDFDRILVDNWLSEEDYQRFINRVIEVYNTEFKKVVE